MNSPYCLLQDSKSYPFKMANLQDFRQAVKSKKTAVDASPAVNLNP
ncbi:MAG: hypothetical protein ACRCUQ_05050 [Alphaproteobacteria bacterium]